MVADNAKGDEFDSEIAECTSSVVECHAYVVGQMLGKCYAGRSVILFGYYNHIKMRRIGPDQSFDVSQTPLAKLALGVIEEYAGIFGLVGLHIHKPCLQTHLRQFVAYDDILGLNGCRCR